jgi:hypothetical protein
MALDGGAVRGGEASSSELMAHSSRWASTGVKDIFEREMGRHREEADLLGRYHTGPKSSARMFEHPLLSITKILLCPS